MSGFFSKDNPPPLQQQAENNPPGNVVVQEPTGVDGATSSFFGRGASPELQAFEEDAKQAAEAAEASANAAGASAASAANSADTAASLATSVSLDVESVVAAQAAAAQNAAAAATSATSAAGSAATATAQAANAATAATQASAAQTSASNSASAANTSATNAAGSATNSSNSAALAAGSASSAANSATAAGTSATNAANSATSAATSATNAANEADDAADSATAAATSATNAATSATQASTSATNAANSATAANTSATAAAGSQSAAATSAANAAASETAAAGSASAASGSATAAANSASAASGSAAAAAASEAAAAASETNAATSETNAATSATGAANSATAAGTSATNAANSASAAAGSATNAATSASNAATSAANAATSETNAAASETAAATSATSAAGSASTATTKAAEASTSAANAAGSATDAANSASSAATSASNAATSAGAAATSATNAANSASAAGTSASNAAGSATSASNSAAAAAGSASAAASAQTAAEAARDSALAAYDQFDDRYLGVKASDPTVDNDGNALVAGALYFNSTAGEMRLYNGSAWVAAYVSGAGVLLIANNLSDLANAATARANLGLAAVAASGAYADLSGRPTAVSAFTNDAGYLTSFTETDPTVPSHVKSITTTNISNWNAAYGWGNHASAGYLTGITSGQVTTALGYTPANRAGDTFTGSVGFAGGSYVAGNGDFVARRSGGSTGVYYFVDANDKYLYWDGAGYYFGGSYNVNSYGFAATGYVQAPIFYDSDNTSFYVDPAGTSVVNGVTFTNSTYYINTDKLLLQHNGTDGYIRAVNAGSDLYLGGSNQNTLTLHTGNYAVIAGSTRSPIFYDSDNTAYYVNPAATSALVASNIGSGVYTSWTSANTDIDALIGGSTFGALIEGANNGHMTIGLRSNDSGDGFQVISKQAGNATYTLKCFEVTAAGVTNFGGDLFVPDSIKHAGDADTAIRFPANDTFTVETAGIERLRVDSSGSVAASVDVRAPIFYDSNNTGYYVDPNGTSNLLAVGVDTLLNLSSGATLFISSASAAYQRVDGRNDGVDARAHWYGVTTSGATSNFRHAWYDGAAYFNVTASGGQIYFERGGGATVNANGDFRAPIFYDSDNTGYYVDPAATSNLAGLVVAGEINGNVGGYARYLPTAYIGGVQTNPQTYFSQSTGLKVAMTAVAGVWSDTVWINGYSGGDVLSMCALHTSRQSTPRMWISTQASNATAYGTLYEFPTLGYNSGNTSGLYAGAFYDTNNSAFYLDPASTGTALSTNGILIAGTGTSGGVQNRTYTAGRNRIWSFANADTYGLSYFQGGPDYIGLHFGTATQAASQFWVSDSGIAQASVSLRAPIFYDSQNTSYYVDPQNTSVLWEAATYYLRNIADVSTDHPYGVYFSSNRSSAYAIYRESGAWTSPYPDLRIAFHTGIKLGANASYQGIRFYTDYDMVTQVMSVNNASDGVGAGHVFVNNVLQAGGDLRAPIFYDSNNTAYYFDGSSTGTSLNVAGSIVAAGNVTAYSDIRVKDNVEQIGGALDRLQAIRGVTYTRNDLDDKERRYAGVIAQEIEQVLPEAVFESGDKKSVDYNATIGLLIEAIKELKVEVETLKKEYH